MKLNSRKLNRLCIGAFQWMNNLIWCRLNYDKMPFHLCHFEYVNISKLKLIFWLQTNSTLDDLYFVYTIFCFRPFISIGIFCLPFTIKVKTTKFRQHSWLHLWVRKAHDIGPNLSREYSNSLFLGKWKVCGFLA